MNLEPIFKTGKQLIPYLTAGDPDLATTKEYLKILADSPVKIVELGIPFSDPLADGPVIQASHQRALRQNVTLQKVLEMVRVFRTEVGARGPVPLQIVFMLDYNLIYHYGIEPFAKDCAGAGVAGVLAPNLPLEDPDGLRKKLENAGVDLIRLVSSSTPPERVKRICENSSGFIYVLSTHGVTGARASVDSSAKATVDRIRAVSKLPAAVGFGISKLEHVRDVFSYADGAIVGSALVKALDESVDKAMSLKQWTKHFNPDYS